MNMIHYSPSVGLQCGIATYAEYLNKYLDMTLSQTGKKQNAEHTILVEYEYGLDGLINFDNIDKYKNKIVLLHAFSVNSKFKEKNDNIMETFDKVIVMNDTMKNIIASLYPDMLPSIYVLPHYTEKPMNIPKNNLSEVSIGIHGFGFPRNGFIELLNALYTKHINGELTKKIKLYVMASINSFNRTAEYETSIYIDKIRRKIWTIESQIPKDKLEITLDCNFYENKYDIIEQLKRNCNRLIFLPRQTPHYYNASGSIHTLFGTRLPIFSIESIFTHDYINEINLYSNIKSLLDDIHSTNIRVPSDAFYIENSVENYCKKLIEIIGD